MGRLCGYNCASVGGLPAVASRCVQGFSFEASSDMNGEATRRAFLHGGALATAGLLATEGTAAGHDSQSDHQQEHAGHSSTADYLRDRPSTGGPLGSPTDRDMLVPEHDSGQRRDLDVAQRGPLRLGELLDLFGREIDVPTELRRDARATAIDVLSTKHEPVRRP